MYLHVHQYGLSVYSQVCGICHYNGAYGESHIKIIYIPK